MKYRSIPMLLTLLTLPQPALRGADSDRIDQRYYFRLTNTFLGDAYSLDTANDGVKGPMMAKSGDYSGQFWMFTRHDGVYRMTNLFLGRSARSTPIQMARIRHSWARAASIAGSGGG